MKPEPFASVGRYDSSLVVDGHDCVEGCHAVERHDRVRSAFGVVKANLQGPTCSRER